MHLNLGLPAELQTNIFCLEDLLLDDTWREQAISQLPVRDQKWWTRTYPMIVGQKGASSTALKPALNALEQWQSQDRIQALLGASISTVRWREIIDESKIVFVALNNDGSETDNLLARLLVGEMVAAFKERGLSPNSEVRPFHLFLDEFQSYAPVLEVQAEVIVQELRKFGAKVHFLCQSPSVLSKRMREIIFANCTHVFCGRLGNPSDAEQMAKLMGGRQVSHRSETTGSVTVKVGTCAGCAGGISSARSPRRGNCPKRSSSRESTPKRPGHICEPVGTSTHKSQPTPAWNPSR